ncbi:hypothetical protein MNBD_BACTEROID01-169 [hydrothermal vent metagenome]|uniref:Outer membrane protein beta-barrel domain-containing protein n=1 Tax=hydrothermal vent metagenome TaxID=652676 RepID=A0A3B0T4F4_9ZZZZ
MKIYFFVILLFLTFTGNAQANQEHKRFAVGIHLVNRQIKGYHFNYTYPRLSFEYRLSASSSVEVLAEYINHKPAGTQVISYPLSMGYKLNILPWLINNKKLIDRLKIYQSLRYTILFSPANSDAPLSGLRIYHHLRYAPGVDFYFNKNWGINYEVVFGQNMRTTMAFGVKYRL